VPVTAAISEDEEGDADDVVLPKNLFFWSGVDIFNFFVKSVRPCVLSFLPIRRSPSSLAAH